MENVIAIRVDVDTLIGLKKGVPNLLRLFSRHGIKATFFIVMGPDCMGRHITRFKKKGYLKRIMSVNPMRLIKSYGISSFLYGTILPPPLIGRANPDLLKSIAAAGHELGIHGYNHNRWADRYSSLSEEEVRSEFWSAHSAYEDIFGKAPEGSAAPNWRSHEKLFFVEDESRLRYASDTRGYYPFRPKANGITLKTLQIPVTLPSTHECLQMGLRKEEVVPHIFKQLKKGLNVWTIHDWYEGLYETGFVEDFILQATAVNYNFATLNQIADEVLRHPDTIQACNIESRRIAGGIGETTWQVNEN